MVLNEPGTADVLKFDPSKGRAPVGVRRLKLEVWYPASAGGRSVRYRGRLPSEAAGRWAPFAFDGLAVRNAPEARGGPYPLVVISHGYSGAPALVAWLAENLASKGYVVAAPDHEDPPITELSKFAGALYLRPLDDAFVAHALQAQARRACGFAGRLIDPDRIAIIGYSMGGYGALAVAGAGIDPKAASLAPGGYLTSFALGGAKAGALKVEGLKAVVAISPFGGRGPAQMFKADGLAALRTPTLFIGGDQDDVVGFEPGLKSLFEGAVNAPRYLLVFKEAGHSIGMQSAPKGFDRRLWDQDWFEDPVWRKARTIGVCLHFITAFLDLYVKVQPDRSAYLDLIPDADAGLWPSGDPAPYAAYSPGSGTITLWKGFQKAHASGLRFLHLAPRAP